MSYIIVSSDERFSKAFSLRLQAKIGVSSILQPNLEQARGFMDILPDVEGIILLKEVSETEFQYFMERVSLENLDLIIPNEQIFDTDGTKIKRWKDHDEIISLLSTTENEVELDYYSFSLAHLEIFSTAPVDYYMMLGEERKYIKMINVGETDLKRSIDNLKKKKIGQIFINKEDVNSLLSRIEKLMSDEFSNPKISPIKLQEQSFKVLKQLGLSIHGLELAQKSADSLIAELESKDDTKSFLSKLYSKSSDRSYQLTYMTSLISVNVLSKFDWATESMKKDLVFASFFNDLHLSGELAFVRTNESFNKLDRSVQADVLSHTVKSNKEILSIDALSQGEAATIILQHHGAVNGNGFGTELDQIRPLSALFLICEEFCVGLLNSEGGKVNIPEILKSIKQTYKGKSVEKYCQAIIDVFKGS